VDQWARRVCLLAVAAASVVLPGCGEPSEPRLVGRAIQSVRASAPAPFPASEGASPRPTPGARQPVGGFSALLDAPGRDTYLAMADNGFGSRDNSSSFLLRVYRLRVRFETGDGGDGDVQIRDWIELRDPDRKVPFRIVNRNTRSRLLTGADFDIESFRRDSEGTLWFGDEFGPFLLHTDTTGKVLEPPIPLPGVRTPDTPPPYDRGGSVKIGRSRGFEAMAISPDGRTLYPALEGAVSGDDPKARRIYEFDIPGRRYARKVRTYRMQDRRDFLADMAAVDEHVVALERDDFEGTKARRKRLFVAELGRTDSHGALVKRQVVDLLDLADPDEISAPARHGDVGIGARFRMPYTNIEAVLPLSDHRVVVVNDTNLGSSHGRNHGRPDDSDFVVVSAPDLPGA
jgi:hypothetical protein